MTSLFQARRRAEEFAAIIDGNANDRAQREEEITSLLGLVAALRDQQVVEPRPDFARDLRSRLMLEAETALAPEAPRLALPTRTRGRRERRLVAAASAFVLIGGTTTMAAAAQSALPGDALYPIKRGIEQAEASISMSSAGKGRDLLDQASVRLTEVESLLDSDAIQSGPRVPATLTAFSSTAREGSTLLFESFRETSDPESIVSVRTFTAEGIAALEAMADSVPVEAQGEATAAAILLHEIDREAAALCSTCAAELPLVEVPGIFLARVEVDRALARAADSELANDHPVVVRRDVLGTAGDAAPVPSASPAGPTAPSDPTPTALPSTNLDPQSWPSLLPGVGGTSTDAKSSDKSLTQELTEDIDSGLTAVVETLLPDPDGTLD